MRIDVLDLGSNTFHLLAAKIVAGNVLALDDTSVAVRMGERAFAKGRITDKAYERGLDAIEALLERCASQPVAVATGVFREAANAGAFLDHVRRRFGLRITVLSGEDEARFTYRGVRGEALDPDARVAVFDLGGGSLECLLGLNGSVELADSLPLGLFRLAKREPAEVRRRVREIAGPIVRTIRDRTPDEVILSSGTARALLRVGRRLGREQVVGCLSAKAVEELASDLAAMSPRAIGALGISISRADVLGVGATILATVVELVGAPFVRIANATLREGVALEAAVSSAPAALLRTNATRRRTA
jgi:exopolyphosphatase/guanosine-5'-triphosphate,3'-diphosphate pyrophosphatase